jgi:hypothetical protein
MMGYVDLELLAALRQEALLADAAAERLRRLAPPAPRPRPPLRVMLAAALRALAARLDRTAEPQTAEPGPAGPVAACRPGRMVCRAA